jgi:hypothetical protein
LTGRFEAYTIHNKQIMNREEYLSKEFPNKEGKTYIQSLDEHFSVYKKTKNNSNIRTEHKNDQRT